jgi:tape measure domain-containing protein
MTEGIEIPLEDKISPNISIKLKAIATDARSANAAIVALQRSIALVGQANSLQTLQAQLANTTTQVRNLTNQSLQAASASQRLAQAQQQGARAAQGASAAIASYVRSLAAIAGVTLSARAVIQAADAYTTLQNKLQTVTRTQAEVNTLTERLFDLANRTRASIEDTTTSFARFDRALKNMGKSQEESLRLTETINKALVVSGATSQEASSALLQLSQAFNAGRLQGDEFRSVSENIPIIMDAIAKSLGVPISHLKLLSSQGKITSEVLFNAFNLLQKQVDSTFGKTVPTISQAFTVLGNSLIKTFGELGQSTGISQAFSKTLISLSENLKGVAVALFGVSAAMLAAFGSTVVNSIASCTNAIKAFSVALASNPLGAAAAVLSTIVAYLTVFRDDIKLTSTEVTTLGDLFRAMFEVVSTSINEVKTAFGAVWALIVSDAKSALDSIGSNVSDSGKSWTDSVSKFFENNRTGWAGALTTAAQVLDGIANSIRTLFSFSTKVMQNLVAITKSLTIDTYNTIIGFIEKVVNAEIEAVNKIRAAIGKAPLQLASFDKIAIDSADNFQAIGKLWADSIADGFGSDSKYFQNQLDDLLKRAAEIAKSRMASVNAALRGSGSNVAGTALDQAALKYADMRERTLEKINAQLDNEINRMFIIQSQREAQARMDAIEESLIGKRIKLTNDEYNALAEKVRIVQQASEVQRKFDQIYNEANGAQLEFAATTEAANRLQEQGLITQEQYFIAVNKAGQAYLTATNALRLYDRDLNQQLKLLQLLPKEQEIEHQMMQLQNDLLARGILLNDSELAQRRAKLVLIQQGIALSQQEAQLLSDTSEKRTLFITQLEAINKLLANKNSGFTRSDALTAIGNTDVGQYLTGSPEMLQAQVDNLGMMYSQIDELRKRDLISAQTAAAAKLQIWNAQQNAQLSTAKTFFSSLEVLQKSKNQTLAKVGKAAAIANALVNTYQSATGAYASLASVPFVGPALGAAAAAAAIVAGMANVAEIRAQSTSFDTGGYTGNMPTNAIAGLVHGREYVMDASATRRLGVANLEALSAGAASIQRPGSARVAQANTAESAVPSNVTPTTQVGNIRIINTLNPAIVGDYLNTPEGEQVLVNVMRRNSDQVRAIVNNA